MLACATSMVFTLPIGVIQATTNQQPRLNIITKLIISYIYRKKPLANVAFKTCGYISMIQALWFLQDCKLGHYIKIPHMSMFFTQLVATVVAASIDVTTSWYLLTGIENICEIEKLPTRSP